MKGTNKNEFLCYCKAFVYGRPLNAIAGRNGGNILAIISTILVGMAIERASESLTPDGNGVVISSIAGVGVLFYLMIMLVGMSYGVRPSILNMLPIPYKRRVVYYYLHLVVLVIAAMIFLFAFSVIFMLFLAVLLFISTGEWMFVAEASGGYEALYVGLQGNLFDLFLLLFVIGMAIIISLIKSKNLRIAALMSFPVLLYLALLGMLNLCGGTGFFRFSGNLFADFETLPLSWLWLTLWAVAAVAAITIATLRLADFFKPKEF